MALLKLALMGQLLCLGMGCMDRLLSSRSGVEAVKETGMREGAALLRFIGWLS